MASFDFNPRSREGSDHTGRLKGDKDDYFNPRSREGSDKYNQKSAISENISIHAPAKGATSDEFLYTSEEEFQSTLPRRERRGDKYE